MVRKRSWRRRVCALPWATIAAILAMLAVAGSTAILIILIHRGAEEKKRAPQESPCTILLTGDDDSCPNIVE